jgi:hypothetical protein
MRFSHSTALSPLERRLLVAILAASPSDLEERATRMRRAPTGVVGAARQQWGRRLAAAQAEAEFGPRIDLAAMLGEAVVPAVRMAACRALRRLEVDLGLIIRAAPWGQRCTHAKLTEAGRKVALWLGMRGK